MKILLLTSHSCLPCEKARRVIRDINLQVEVCERPHSAFALYEVVYTPCLVVDTGKEVHKLTGAHMITRIEVEGLLRDLDLDKSQNLELL